MLFKKDRNKVLKNIPQFLIFVNMKDPNLISSSNQTFRFIKRVCLMKKQIKKKP